MYGQQFPQNSLYGTPNMMSYHGVMQPPISPQGTAPGMLSNYNNNPNRGGYDASQANRNMGQRQPPRQRNNEIGEVSRVIHMRNITPNVTQLSIQNLVQNFGNIKHIVMLRQMNQALVEMESTKSAQQLVDFFRQTGYAEIDGRRVYIRYSNHQELTATQHTSKTLLVSMFNTQYDVSAAAQITPMIVYQIFGNYGSVQKIVVLPKNESSQRNHNRVQALVQFDSKVTAENVKSILQGQPVTIGDTVTFTLDIQFSRMDDIKTSNPAISLVINEDGVPQPPQPPQPPMAPPPPPPPPAPQQQPHPSPQQQQVQGGNMYPVIPQQWS
ncbi:Double RNA binding domain protein 3 [Trypanosoma cruzi]|uniref:RNA-binding protein, putative n=4 Tax=Trypanosoma cruzi TaxID=5693 RepID=Q4DE30_TRYCC|nr:RNA-binding protein, putative [Trypanosoma cruzi]EAN90786.1 RNA-binding protein, putative [Trypanosoma cruzi]KAF8289508.1 Double RNA binding domain protein 3 [Trypanosoma cruzi]PWV12459.1 Double RNA binding domain protein 3 [Trypanosoma cruzi]|eukprot:XP_812637.1 RNA-binding protein [Trypanosoma cruzi strain CL Brener]